MCRKVHAPITMELFHKVKEYIDHNHTRKQAATKFGLGESTVGYICRADSWYDYTMNTLRRKYRGMSDKELMKRLDNMTKEATYDRLDDREFDLCDHNPVRTRKDRIFDIFTAVAAIVSLIVLGILIVALVFILNNLKGGM